MTDSIKTQAADLAEDLQEVTAEALMEIEKAIKTYVAALADKQGEARELSATIKDALENDVTYAEVQKKVKEVQKEVAKVKEQLEKTPSVISAKEQIKSLKADMKDMQQHLSKRLLEFKKAGMSEIELHDGTLQSILEFAKLAKKRT
ncbi:MAG: hypothetical protein ACMG6E_02600 [Candidatus Roizmanbacteria bacterium]